MMGNSKQDVSKQLMDDVALPVGVKMTSGRSFKRTALASAIALSCGLSSVVVHADTLPRNKFRMVLDDVISSEPDTVAQNEFDGRLPVQGLIQSDPDPLLIELEERYAALPPMHMAVEERPETMLAVNPTEAFRDRLKELTTNVSRFTPRIRTYVRYDDFHENDIYGPRDYSTLLVAVNPTFRYEKTQRKWSLRALYDYERGEYFLDNDEPTNDHHLDVKFNYRLTRGNEITVSALVEDTHDRVTTDPIQDFDSSVEGENLDYTRALVNINYSNGTMRDRSRYKVYLFNEASDLNSSTNFVGSEYELDRNGIGGEYTWQIRKQLSLVGQVRYHDFDYRVKYRDNTQYRALVGTSLVLGRRIRADIRVGYEQKTFDYSQFSDDTIGKPVWRASALWALRRNTTLALESGREIFELVTVDSPVDTSRFQVQDWIRTRWKERWSSNFHTEATFVYRTTDFEGRDNDDDAIQVIATAIYQATNKLELALDAAYTREKSDFGADLIRRTFTFRTDLKL